MRWTTPQQLCCNPARLEIAARAVSEVGPTSSCSRQKDNVAIPFSLGPADHRLFLYDTSGFRGSPAGRYLLPCQVAWGLTLTTLRSPCFSFSTWLCLVNSFCFFAATRYRI